MSRPVLYLDVDGVVNALVHRPSPDYTHHVIEGFDIHLHREVRDMVAALAEHFDIVWFTLWNERAAPSIGPHVGLESAPHLSTSWTRGEQVMAAHGYGRQSVEECLYAKTPLLAMHVDFDDRWVWIDDDHGQEDFAYLLRNGADPDSFRLLRTDAATGLTWDTVREAIDFAQGRSEPDWGPDTQHSHRPGSAGGRTWAVGTDVGAGRGPGDECPQCGTRLARVVYGEPAEELQQQAERGEVVLGGCMPMGPRTQCPGCGWSPPGHDWD